jgi:hypothetical protein
MPIRMSDLPHSMRSSRTISTLLALLCLVLLASTTTSASAAGEVRFETPSGPSYVGVARTVDISITDPTTFEQPVLPSVDGVAISVSPDQSRTTSRSIVGGRVFESSQTVIRVLVVPEKPGTFTIPPISIVVDGKTWSSEPFTIVARPSDNDGLLTVELESRPQNPYVGQSATLVLRLIVQQYRDPTENITLSAGDMWSLIDAEGSSWGPFLQRVSQLAQARQRPTERETLKNDRTTFVYEITDPWTPKRPGPPDLEEISIALNWPTGVRRTTDFFGRANVQLRSVRPLRVAATPIGLEARPLPESGRPDSFTGAVGRFTVAASATPTNVRVGDPITLTFTVRSQSGAATLESLAPPAFASIPALAGFRIPSEGVGGTVRDREKTFTQTIRAEDPSLTEIPPIPFSYFDPDTNRYVEVATTAIPLVVEAAERIQLSDIVGARATAPSRREQELTTVAGGLLANVPPAPALLGRPAPNIGPATAALVLLPPAVAAALFVGRAIARRRAADPLRRRAQRAASVARAALERSRSSTGGPTSPANAALDALTAYVGDRRGLPEGRRTRPEVVAALKHASIDPAIVEGVDRLLATCERSRYAPAGSETVSIDEARSLVDRLDRVLPAVSATGGAA